MFSSNIVKISNTSYFSYYCHILIEYSVHLTYVFKSRFTILVNRFIILQQLNNWQQKIISKTEIQSFLNPKRKRRLSTFERKRSSERRIEKHASLNW